MRGQVWCKNALKLTLIEFLIINFMPIVDFKPNTSPKRQEKSATANSNAGDYYGAKSNVKQGTSEDNDWKFYAKFPKEDTILFMVLVVYNTPFYLFVNEHIYLNFILIVWILTVIFSVWKNYLELINKLMINVYHTYFFSEYLQIEIQWLTSIVIIRLMKKIDDASNIASHLWVSRWFFL